MSTGALRPFRRPEGAVYGPVASRRFGRTLGINVCPPGLKVCSFNCVYCQLGWGSGRFLGEKNPPGLWPSAGALLGAIDAAIAAFDTASIAGVEGLVFSGDGEPTLHPEFPAIVRGVAAMRDRRLPGRRVIVLSNGTEIDRAEIREALADADVRALKLDAGKDRTFRRINRPFVRMSLEDYVACLSDLPGVTIQSMFVRGVVDNTGPDEVRAWIERLRRARPVHVQIYTLDREPPAVGLEPVPKQDLDEIARAATDALRIPVATFS